MSPTDTITTKLGCYTHSSDFRATGVWEWPGIRWKKNFLTHTFTMERPKVAYSILPVECPVCAKVVMLKVPSFAYGKKKRMFYGIVAAFLLIGIALLIMHDFSSTTLDGDQIGTIKVQGTIWGTLFALFFFNNARSQWICYVPTIKRDFMFRFWRHKLFHT